MFRHQFSKENRSKLLEYLKVARAERSNIFCNHNEYEQLKQFFPLQHEIKKLLDEYISNTTTVIDLTDAEDEKIFNDKTLIDQIDNHTHSLSTIGVDKTDIDDITYAIKENINQEKCLSALIMNQMQNYLNQEQLFLHLSNELNVEEILDFGKILISDELTTDSTIANYVRCLLLENETFNFTEKFIKILTEILEKYPELLVSNISKYILAQNEYCAAIQTFLNGLNSNLKSKLLKEVLGNSSVFQKNHIQIFESLLNNQTDIESLNKIVHISATASHLYSTNKDFGKLVLNLINCLGRNINSVEPVIAQIVSSHKSIWKAKIQRCLEDMIQHQDSQIFTQSFR